MCVGVDWKGLRCILTCYGLKPTQCHPIHMDSHQNEQALKPLQDGLGLKQTSQRVFRFHIIDLVTKI